jgi:putative membrane protein
MRIEVSRVFLWTARLRRLAPAAIVAPGILFWWMSEFHPASVPPWMPWNFSWLAYLALVSVLAIYLRGLALLPDQERPKIWRRFVFLGALALLYGVTQSRFDYMAQHMFFINRIQHVAMHHLGPFLAVLGQPGAAIRAGMPPRLRGLFESRFVAKMLAILQQPLLAVFLFVGLFFFWLIPPIHVRAMLDERIYELMNWSMILDGFLFWSLILDQRPKPPARLSFGLRFVLCVFVMFPQILLGSMITFASRDLYPYYDLCGRLFPSVSAIDDQHIGGIVIWIPPAMMSVVGALLVLNGYRLQEMREELHAASPSSSAAGR